MLLSNLELLATAPGGVAKLRELILTLAVQGKLVPQDPADEPASVLLQKIRAEKDRLIAEGKIKKDKPLAAIAEEEKPFELPVGWEWVRIGNVLSLEYGSSLPEKERLPGSIPVYGSNGIVGLHTSALVSEPSLIVGRKGSVGAINISMVPFWPIDTSYFVTPPDGIELQFAFHLLKSLGLAKHDKATAIPGINRNDVYAEIVGLPPLAEQSRIVARVEELMRLCDAVQAKGQLEATQHAQLLSTLLGTLTASATPEELAIHWQRVAQHFELLLDRPEAIDALEQILLQLAVRGLLVPQDPADEPASVLLQKIRAEKDRLIAAGQIKRDKSLPPITDEEKPFELPVGWEWRRMGAVVNATEAGWSPSCIGSPRRHGLWGVLKVSAVSWGEFDAAANKELPLDLAPRPEYEVHDGDFLLSRANTAELVARSVVVGQTEPKLMLSDKIIRLAVSSQMNRFFLNMANNASYAREHYAVKASGTSSSMKNVSREVVLALPVPVPPLAEQSRIVTRVTELRALCQQLREKLTQARHTQTCLAQAWVEQVTG